VAQIKVYQVMRIHFVQKTKQTKNKQK